MIANRRRVLRIMALSTAAAAAPTSLLAGNKNPELYSWNGVALGADTSIQLYANDKAQADQVLDNAARLIEKYEGIFNLYDPNSFTSRLNRDGRVGQAPAEFIDLVRTSKNISEVTSGAFDVTVQPLWDVYSKHFGGDDNSDLDQEISKIIPLIGSDGLMIERDNVSFKKENMAVSFNGIAQGFITDKVTEYLVSEGYRNILVDMGEYRAAGPQENGDPWRIGLLDPFDTVSIADVIEMDAGAVATSGGYGNQFDASGKYHHLFNPVTGRSSDLYASVTVTAPNATSADAYSTAFSNMTVDEIKTCLGHVIDLEVRLTDNDGQVSNLYS